MQQKLTLSACNMQFL